MTLIKHAIKFTTRTLFFTTLFFTVFVLFLAAYIKKEEFKIGDRIYPNVYIDSYNAGLKTKDEVEQHFQQKDKDLRKTIVFLRHDAKEATFSGQLLQLSYDSEKAINNAYTIGRKGLIVPQIYQKIVTILDIGRYRFSAPLTYNKSPITEYLMELDDKYSRKPEDALFQFENGRVIAFKVEKNGIKVNTEKAHMDLDIALKRLPRGRKDYIVVDVKDTIFKPAVTLASINNLGIEEEIGRGVSNYSGSIPGRVHNVILATSLLNGVIIPQGQTFSFNRTIGDISAATGYQQAYIIKDGQTILGDDGGVCQTSTTLFRAALNTGLPIVERVAHAYRVHYYENDKKPGFDATTFAPSVDLKFKNDTPAAILIQTEINKETEELTYIFYGKKDGRQVTVSDVSLWDPRPAPEPRYQDDPTLKRGITKQVDWAASGIRSKFHYKSVRADGTIIQDRDFISNYRPWQAVYLVGTGE
jgi:vancomycin resistance protein YoaR